MIEDVAYMRSHTVQETYMFMVDSRNRDKSAHPEPSEYSVTFNAPFRNVCSFSLLDATIPRTHYSVDVTSNTLVYGLGGEMETFTASVPPGDYTLIQLLDALNGVLLGGLVVEPVTNPYEISNKVRFTRAAGPFTLLMKQSGLRTALGFPEGTFTPSAYGPQTDAHIGPFKSTQTLPLSSTTHVRQKFTALASGTVTGMTVAVDPMTSPSVRIQVVISSAAGGMIARGSIVPSRSSAAVLEPGGGALVEGAVYSLTVSSNEPTSVYVAIGTGVGTVESSSNSGTSFQAHGEDVQLCCGASVSQTVQSIESPGLVDVTGEKLVLVRCPEIEQVMYRERYNERGIHAGLGYVKMGALGYREQRQDYFVPFPPRIFHPISKFSKFTIRLENPDGTLYNTRGVDHFLLLNITYYKVAAENGGGSPLMLNPSYTPEIHKYVAERATHRAWAPSTSTSAWRPREERRE